MQVLNRFVVVARVVERRLVRVSLEHGVGDRNVHHVAELLEVVEAELLHLMRRIATLERRSETVTLDRLGQDDRRLTLVLARGLERRVHLAIVVAAALEAPELVVAEVFDHRESAWVAAKKVLANVGA